MKRRKFGSHYRRFLLPLSEQNRARLRHVNHRIEFLTKIVDRLKWERTVLMKDVPALPPRRPRALTKSKPKAKPPVQPSLF